ncbi:MAG: heterodisulfide reductase-related iron-sulfur binding cluster [Bryobacteraceae bacterium]|nr:heterodisulfide reductase-related iron-sulfur binding cluster [Bryobacteraceae bacterium]
MAASEYARPVLAGRHDDAPAQKDLDKCVHCGLCLNSCPTYRELGIEMDSPRGRIYQMVQVATGAAPVDSPEYLEHLGLCLGCRGCETACPSGVPYGRLIEAARTEIQARVPKPGWQRAVEWFVFTKLLSSPFLLQTLGFPLWIYRVSGLQRLVRASGILKLMGPLGRAEAIAPDAEMPTFYGSVGKVFPAEGERRYKVAFMAGCMANVFFARLNEATVRVLQKNGCEVHIPADQNCCGALHAHAGFRDEARKLARVNIDAVLGGGFDAILTNAGGCGSTLKEYGELLEHDPVYSARAHEWVQSMRDVNEFLASIELNRRMGEVKMKVTYQDSCHLAHGQKVRSAPRQLLKAVPGLQLVEMMASDVCCGSAGIYNVVQNEMSMQILESKMRNVNATGAEAVATANPGCLLQIQAGARRFGHGQRAYHVMEILDMAYRAGG